MAQSIINKGQKALINQYFTPMTSLQCSYTENQLRKEFSKTIFSKRTNCGYCGSFKVKKPKTTDIGI